MFSDADKAETRDQPHTRIGAGWHPAPDAADDIRERVIRTIEAQRAPLEQLKAQIRSSQVDHEGEDALEWIEQRLSYLDGLQSIASSAPLPALLSLDLKMPAVAAASTSVLTAARTEAAHQIGHAIGEHTHEGYGHATHALEKRVRNTDAANNRHFQSAMDTLERHGLDGTFRRNQSELEAEREAAEKKGDHGKARVADALAGRNTLYALDRALELEEDPQKREQLEAERQRQIDVVAEREAAMRKQLHLDGLKAAQQDGLSGQEAENRAKEHVDRQLEIYRERDEKLYRDAGSPDASRHKETQEEIDRKRLMQEGKLDEHLLNNRRHLSKLLTRTLPLLNAMLQPQLQAPAMSKPLRTRKRAFAL